MSWSGLSREGVELRRLEKPELPEHLEEGLVRDRTIITGLRARITRSRAAGRWDRRSRAPSGKISSISRFHERLAVIRPVSLRRLSLPRRGMETRLKSGIWWLASRGDLRSDSRGVVMKVPAPEQDATISST